MVRLRLQYKKGFIPFFIFVCNKSNTTKNRIKVTKRKITSKILESINYQSAKISQSTK